MLGLAFIADIKNSALAVFTAFSSSSGLGGAFFSSFLYGVDSLFLDDMWMPVSRTHCRARSK